MSPIALSTSHCSSTGILQVLKGKKLDQASAGVAADAAFAGAEPRKHNAFKIELGKRTLARALLETRNTKV